MQITMEKIIWIALVLVVAAVVGFFLMNVATTQSKQVAQKAYVRLISSNYVDDIDGSGNPGYVVTVRVVNSGEPNEIGGNITLVSINPVGFDPGLISGITPNLPYTLTPKQSLDLSINIQSRYIEGTKSIILNFDTDGDTTAAEFTLSVPVP